MTKQELYRFLAQHKLGVLSSIADSKLPQSALVGIAVTPDLEIVFDTVKSSRKYPNLAAQPQCSFVIGWAGEQTVQWEGVAKELTGAELETYQAVYFAAWPECRTHLAWPGIVYFVVQPKWVRYSDFATGLIQEFTF
jgi:pyridoxine/pyridoxamine 5'-phosphate oxidase